MKDQNGKAVQPSRTNNYIDLETWDSIKAAGIAEEDLLKDQPFGPMISMYTRAQAIADGVLVDVTDAAKPEGFTVPVAVTSGVWVKMTPKMPPPFHPEWVTPTLIVGLLRKVRRQIRRNIVEGKDTDTVVLHDMEMWAKIGPGDKGEPVLTIMLEGED